MREVSCLRVSRRVEPHCSLEQACSPLPHERWACGSGSTSARCPPCQSSCTGRSPRVPRRRSCGASRRLRLSSAKPGNWARVSTAFHNGTASSSLGMREITGPKKDTPSGGANVMIGVPTSRPVRLRASWVSASSSASHLSSSAAGANATGSPRARRTSPMWATVPSFRLIPDPLG
jgi:hypothetical protein